MAKRGKKISHLMPCPYCGEEIAEDALFCPSCGNSISSPLRGGTLLHNGRYKIIKQLGAGGMATIYLAEDINLGNTLCVIKVMADKFNDKKQEDYLIKKFKEEAIILARLRHNGLPVVQNHFSEDGRYYLVMDFIEGNTLEHILSDALKKDCFLPEEKVIAWGIQTCDILYYLHSHDPMVIHRDIKPENIMEHKNGRVILVDFGIAHIFDKREAQTEIGTAGFASPEQYMGKAYPQSDIFALGAALHRLLTGYDLAEGGGSIFKYPHLDKFRDDLSSELQDIISKATAFEYKERFSSALEMKKAFIKIQEKNSQDSSAKKFKKALLKSHKEDFPAPLKAKNLPSLVLPEKFRLNTISTGPLKEELSKLLAIDIGSYEIKLLQLDGDRKGYIYPRVIATKKTPRNAFFEGVIIKPEIISKSLEAIIKNRLKEDTVVITSLSPYCSVIKTLETGKSSKKSLPSILAPKLKKIIPLPVEDCYIKYDIISEKEKPGLIKARIIAIRKSAYESLEKTLQIAGIKSFRITLEPYAITLVTSSLLDREDKNTIIVNKGAEGTSLNIITDGLLSQSSFFYSGGNKFTEMLMKNRKIDYEKAEKLKKSGYDKEAGDISESLYKLLRPSFEEWYEELMSNIRKMGYNPEDSSGFIFCGGGFLYSLFCKYIDNNFKLKYSKFFIPENRKNISQKQKKVISDKGPLFMPCIGFITGHFSDEENIKAAIERNKFNLFEEIKSYSTSRLADKKKDKRISEEKTLNLEGLVENPIKEIESYFTSIAGPVASRGLNDSIKKLGYTKETFPLHQLERLIEVFICKFNFEDKIISEVTEKMKMLQDYIVQERSTVKLPEGSIFSPYEEIKKYLSSEVGSIAETVLEEIITGKGYDRENLSGKELESILEIFTCKFNLSNKVSLNIVKRLQEISNK